MKFTLTALAALATGVFASPVEKRIIAQEFDVSEFSASCIPHGTLCTFNFNVATNQMPSQTNCQASFTTAFRLPEVPFTACEDPSVIWSFRAIGLPDTTASNYTLILADPAQSLAAAKIWDAAEFPVLNDGATVHQQYSGPARFVVQ